jgi:hypothetical protein
MHVSPQEILAQLNVMPLDKNLSVVTHQHAMAVPKHNKTNH